MIDEEKHEHDGREIEKTPVRVLVVLVHLEHDEHSEQGSQIGDNEASYVDQSPLADALPWRMADAQEDWLLPEVSMSPSLVTRADSQQGWKTHMIAFLRSDGHRQPLAVR